MQIEKILISYSYSHQNSSSGKRVKILNKHFLINSGWKIITSEISPTLESNTQQIPTLIDKKFKPISYSNTESRRTFKSIALKFLWPDKGIFWAIKTTFKLIFLLNRSSNNFKIVTVSYPFSTHLVGAFLKLIFRKKVHYIAHFMDGFYLINKGNGAPLFLAPLSYLAESLVYKMSDKIIVNRSKYDDFSKVFKSYVSKCIAVDELPGLYLQSLKSQAEGVGRCLFAGSLYKNIRNPDKVLEIFSKIPRIKLKVAGNLNDCVDILDQRHIEYLGLLNEAQVIDQLEKADYLINIDNQDLGQQPPGKIIEYMQLQKPIINFYLKSSISGSTLKKFSLTDRSYLEINLADELESNIQKILNFSVPKQKIFNVPNNYQIIYELYDDGSRA